MKVLLFSDLHDSSRGLKALIDFLSKNQDIVGLVFAGDLTNMGQPVEYVRKFISEISEFNLPLLWVPGNNDFGESYKVLQDFTPSLEGRVVELAEKGGISRLENPMARDEGRKVLRFTGVGGSPASWESEYRGEQTLKKEDIAGKIFVSHYPPDGIRHTTNHKSQITNRKQISNHEAPNSKDVILSEAKDPNNQTMKQSNNEVRFTDAPIAHICGHLHSTYGIGWIGQTKVIQLASSALGHIAIMDLSNLKVKFIKL